MARCRSILIDARVNGIPGGHGLARSVLGLASQLGEPDDGIALRVLVNTHRKQLFPLDCLPAHADVVDTDITPGAAHRCHELAAALRALHTAVLYVPYMSFTPLLRPCPFVVTLHDTTLEKDAGYAGGWLRQQASVAGTRLVLRHAAAVTVPSSASLTEIKARYPQAPHSTLVPNGIHAGVFADVPAAAVARARERYRLPAEFVLAVGAHRPHKNHQVLIRALGYLPERVHLVLVGYFDGNFRDPLPALIARLGLRNRVRLVPEVDDELLPAVYRAASAFAFPSLSEGFGLPALEALAAGAPWRAPLPGAAARPYSAACCPTWPTAAFPAPQRKPEPRSSCSDIATETRKRSLSPISSLTSRTHRGMSRGIRGSRWGQAKASRPVRASVTRWWSAGPVPHESELCLGLFCGC